MGFLEEAAALQAVGVDDRRHLEEEGRDLAWAAIGRGFGVVAVAGIAMVALNVRTIRSYD